MRRWNGPAVLVLGSILIAFLSGCSVLPGGEGIVYPSTLPSADRSTAPRPTATALPVDPAVRDFCSAVATPIIRVQVAVDDMAYRGGDPQVVIARTDEARRAFAPYASSSHAEIAATIPPALGYFDQLSAAASARSFADLLTAVGEAESTVFLPLVNVCAGQPGWE